ncbi:methyltransferase domain-containing protein [Asticcacaulis sp. AC402]|uniref:methyltransferase domain-containing protein n=1 Tax=Asticcacaulis sp. AC402 TaxID=1282361 RepID=UPI0003C3DC76|nr:methyltransferase domain-containing protein [Asticcacaulis sp. AC402]ESQ74044.1 hypothetical protein ABAC402_16230 [Asticcacaulis sp. AC402]
MVSLRSLSLALILMLGAAPAFASPECAADATTQARVSAALARADRPADQVERDAVRKAEIDFLLSHIKPGDRVLDIGAGQGYASYLLSTAVCDGKVVSQNPQSWVDYYKMGPARDAMAAARPNVSLMTADFTAIPAPTQPYDVIFLGMVYHDTYNYQPADYNVQTFLGLLKAQLKPGGVVIITDHDTAAGVGITQTNTLHRIEKARVLADFHAAGFVLAEDSPVLETDEDHSKNVFDPTVRGHTDRMALVFKRP